jgi:hypothetical protein
MKLRFQLGKVLDAVFAQGPECRMFMLTLTEPSSSWNDFGEAIGRLLKAVGSLIRSRVVKRAVKHWFRALEVTCPRPGQFHPHFHVLLFVPAAYLEAHSALYITQAEWVRLWGQTLEVTDKRIIDIRVTENEGEVAKYVTKPSSYLELAGDQWRCESEVLESLHNGLASRRMLAWSRSLSSIRKALGFLDDDGGTQEDLIDVGDEDEGFEWQCARMLTYRWTRGEDGWAYRLKYISLPDMREAESGADDG